MFKIHLALIALISLLPFTLTAETQPNILIIYADDMGYGDLAYQNPESKIPTPHLDRLAESGLHFSDGHSSSGICTPSRYALLTGRYHWRKFHGIVEAFGPSFFAPERLTLPEMLQTKGYHTAAIGKWHLGFDWEAIRHPEAESTIENRNVVWSYDAFDWSKPIPDGPLDHGFDHYFGDGVINFPPYCWIQDDKVTAIPDTMMDTELWKPIKEGSWECRPGPMVSDWDPYMIIPTLTEHAVDYIHKQAADEAPFFLYFALPSPHAPIIPNDPFDGKSEAGAYGDFMYETDDACGQILQALEASGQAKNTIVVFTADNGPEHYAYPRDADYGHWSSAPYRGLKRDIYEGGHHVPFLIRWPGLTEPGSSTDALVSQIDLMATFAELVGYELPDCQAEDSLSLLSVISGQKTEARSEHVHNTFKQQFALREGEWVFIDSKTGYRTGRYQNWDKAHGYDPVNPKITQLLFNIKEDPSQRHNLAAEQPERVTAMKTKLDAIKAESHYLSKEQ